MSRTSMPGRCDEAKLCLIHGHVASRQYCIAQYRHDLIHSPSFLCTAPAESGKRAEYSAGVTLLLLSLCVLLHEPMG